MIIGRARTVGDPRDLVRYEQLLRPRVNIVMNRVIAIEPEIMARR